ncbi:MAG: glycosyltransferase, partial [Acidobacteriota bacterium]|nr:glycosyltransferase [Acidobacteriota bacterium]
LRPWLWKAAVSIDPLRIGAGLQNKILEGMAARRPVVATTVANEGIGAADGQEIVLADAPARFADAIIGLFQDPARAARIAAGGHALVTTRWSWEAYFDPLEAEMVRLAGVGGGRV